MTTTSEYLNEFTPDWPHGHVLVYADGTAKPFVVKVTDAPGEFPIWGYVVGNEGPWTYLADGSSGSRQSRLRNVAPPKREPREVWVNYYQGNRSVPLESRELADEVAVLGRIECVRFREVIEETEAGEEKLPDDFSLVDVKVALHKPHQIDESFKWKSAPQGSDFWLGYRTETLSPEGMALAREALRRWIAIAEKEVTP